MADCGLKELHIHSPNLKLCRDFSLSTTERNLKSESSSSSLYPVMSLYVKAMNLFISTEALVCLLGYCVSVGLLCVCWIIVCLLGYCVSVGLLCVCWPSMCLLAYCVSVGLVCV